MDNGTEWPQPDQVMVLWQYWPKWYWNCVNSIAWLKEDSPGAVRYSPEELVERIGYYEAHKRLYERICKENGIPLGVNPKTA